MESILQLFDYAGLIPHGHCFLWRDDLVLLHVFSDGLIALSYYFIPVSLGVLIWKRRDTPLNWLFVLFAAFIFACGTTHIFSIVTLWKPLYGIEGSLKLVTALISAVTAILLVKVLPEALALPGLKETNEKLSVVTDSLPVLIGYVDQTETYRMNNSLYEEWFGISRADLRGRTVREVTGDASYERLKPRIQAALRGDTVTFSDQLTSGTDQVRHVEATYVPEVVGGEVLGFYALISDVSDRIRADEAELESERLRVLAETAGAAAHEINQPLTALIGGAELLLRMDLDEKAKEAVRVVKHSGERISQIVSTMKEPKQYVTKLYMGQTDIVDFEESSSDTEGEKN